MDGRNSKDLMSPKKERLDVEQPKKERLDVKQPKEERLKVKQRDYMAKNRHNKGAARR